MKIIKCLMLSLCFIAMPTWFMAQQNKVVAAIDCMDRGNIDSAKILIDEAALHAETSSNPETWYVKGFIYKELCKRNLGKVTIIKYGKESFESLKHSIDLDTSAERRVECTRVMKGGLMPYMNNSLASLMDTSGFSNSEKLLTEMKKIVRYLNPIANVDSVDIKFYSAAGTYYQNLYAKNMKTGGKMLDYAQDAFNKVLIKDPNNYSANYNMGIVYYNQGVNLIIHQLDYDSDLGTTLNSVQDKSLELFKKSLPFMLKAYSINPKKKDPIVGLSGIYWSLNEDDKYEEFKRKTDELEKQQ